MNGHGSRRGRFVVIVGPDGVGKTTLAAELLRSWPGERGYFHFRPPIRGPLPPHAPEGGGLVAAKPDPAANGSRLLGWVRLLRNLALFGAGHLFSIRPALRRGALVVGDRWAYPYLAAPAQVHYYGPEWLARSVVCTLPQPDLVVCLTAPPHIVVARKAELTMEQVEAQNRTWQSVPARHKTTLLALDPPELLAARVLEQL
jgi:energy-coupling factor transporter ATP-binding protein EcfA2